MGKMGAVVVLTVALAACPAVWSHPGGLDAEGCHTNRKTGDRHCHREGQADTGFLSAVGSGGGKVKLSSKGICHDAASPWYEQTKNFTAYPDMAACLKAGGRPAKY